jgi:polyhydroxyalkanoate synthesis regulator phasin
MEQTQILKQMVEFNQTLFNNTFNAVIQVQDQSEQMVKNMLDQGKWVPAEGRKVVEDWVGACKTGRDEFKKYVDDGYKYLETFLAR